MKYKSSVRWEKQLDEVFTDNQYSRTHTWTFDGGTVLLASSSPLVVPIPMSNAAAVDPEEAFVAALSSCHMLFFLAIAAAKNYCIETYEDHAEGIMNKNEQGKMAMTEVTLQPKVTFSGQTIPSFEQITHLHQLAHEKCFIANSVKSTITIIPF